MMKNGTLEHSDVVFMYAESDPNVYQAYGGTVQGWGGARSLAKVRELEALGIHPTGAMWCLTAGAKALHEDTDLCEATARDIEGNPLGVPWQRDLTYEGTPTLFGCTNHPTFRAHVRKEVCRAMAGGAKGLHIDDHMGVARAVMLPDVGGGFCDHCMSAFRRYLVEHNSPELLAEAGVTTFEGFDYRDLVRQYATTRERYLEVQDQIPLYQTFLDCQLQLAAENVRQLHHLAQEIVGHSVTLSANTFLTHIEDTVVTPYLCYLICENEHHAEAGIGKLLGAVRRYRVAEAVRRPMAATSGGSDWAYVKERKAETLVRIWIALGYACGQRFMAPSSHQWCHTHEKGTHWYNAPLEAYAPLYRFVRQNRALFDDLHTVGPLAVPAGVPETFETHAKRQSLDAVLNVGDPQPLAAGDRIWVFPREGRQGSAVAHLVNLDYNAANDQVMPAHNVVVRLPAHIYRDRYGQATLYAYDNDPLALELTVTSDGASVRIPELRQWAVIKLG